VARKPSVKFLSGKPTNEQRAIAGLLNEIAFKIQTKMFEHDRVATGEAINSFKIIVNKTNYVMSVVDHLKFAIQGREAGAFPWEDGVNPLIKWILDKPIELKNGITVEQLAFLIGRKIARDGTKGPHIEDSDLDVIYSDAYQKFNDRIADVITRDTVQKLDILFSKNGIKTV